jgi:hypothetical protein
MKQALFRGILIAAGLFAGLPAHAGGPLSSLNGRSVIYQESALPLSYSVDRGDLGIITNADATALVDTCFATWQAVPTAQISFSNAGPLPEDVNGSNYTSYFDGADGINPILFDDDGSIVDAFFGAGASDSVIGFAGSEFDEATGYYTEGVALLNGKFSTAFTYDQFKATFVHEFGHFFGLDHCQINAQYAGDGNTANDVYLPTMFPTATDDDTPLAGLNPDDIAALTLLYPAAAPAVDSAFGKIRGTVTWRSGLPVLGANVVAVKTGDENMSQFSSVSDYYQQNTGAYEMLVTPGTYRLFIEPVNRQFTGGSSVGPYAQTLLSPAFTRPVLTAYYSAEVTVAAGETVEDIAFIARPAGMGICPAARALGDNAPATNMLRVFRDTVLAATPRGQSYIRLYEDHAPELVSLITLHPELRRACRKMLRRLAPELQLMLLRTTPGLSGALRRDIEQLCAGMAEQATPALRRALLNILRDVRDPAAVQNIIALRGE